MSFYVVYVCVFECYEIITDTFIILFPGFCRNQNAVCRCYKDIGIKYGFRNT